MAFYEFSLKLLGWGEDVDEAFEMAIKRLVTSPKETIDQEVEYVEVEFAPNLLEIAEASRPIGDREH